jgi:hypothetical protein
VLLLGFCTLAATAALADESLRIARPQRGEGPERSERSGTSERPERRLPAGSEAVNNSEASGASAATSASKSPPPKNSSADSCCGSSPCSEPSAAEDSLLTNSLPAEGLYTRWRNEFVNPTMCPIRLCHGSCARTSMGCKNIKTMIDSLLDAYIPEEQPIQAVLNFRCCAGFSDD